MNSLFIDRRGVSLKVDGESLTVHENNVRIQSVPLAPLKRVFIHGEASFDSSLLAELGRKGIGLGVLYGGLDRLQLMLPMEGQDAQRRVAQYRMLLDADKCLGFARQLIRAKCAAQSALLTEWAGIRRADADTLKKAARRIQSIAWGPVKSCVSMDVLRGLEGAAAAIHFDALAGILPEAVGFNTRNRRPPRDPFNTLLSLGYSLLQAEAVLALQAAGLDPYAGIYHVPAHGRASLACDLMEPVRPLIDGLCLQLMLTGALTPEDFGLRGKRCELLKRGRGVFFPAYERVMSDLRRAMWAEMRDLGKWTQGAAFDFEAVALSDLTEDDDD